MPSSRPRARGGARATAPSGGRPRQRASTGSRSGLEYKKSALVGGALPVYRRFTRISPTAGGQWSAPAPSQRDLSTGVPTGGGRPKGFLARRELENLSAPLAVASTLIKIGPMN